MEIDSQTITNNNTNTVNNNNNINNNDNLLELDEISNNLNKISTNNKSIKYNRNSKIYKQYYKIVEQELKKWYCVILKNNKEEFIRAENDTELLSNNDDIKKIKYSGYYPTYYKIQFISNLKNPKNYYNYTFKRKDWRFVENVIPYRKYIWEKIHNHNKKITDIWNKQKIKPNTKKAVLYGRTSVQNDVSIDTQIEDMISFCLTKHMYIDNIIEDDGVSGWYNKKTKCMNNKKPNSDLDTIINLLNSNYIFMVYRIDRLGRYQPVTQQLLDGLLYKDINVYFYTEEVWWNKDMSMPIKNFVKQSLVDAHKSSEEKSKISTLYHQNKKKKGIRYKKISPYGYRIDNDKILPVENEQKIVKKIISWRNKNYKFTQIAKKINNIPARNRSGNDFTSSHINSIYKRFCNNNSYLKSKTYYNLSKLKSSKNKTDNSVNNKFNLVDEPNLGNNFIIINNYKYKIQSIPKDGNCLYNSVAFQLNKKFSKKIESDESFNNYTLRAETSKYMAQNKSEFINSYDPSENNNLSYDEYVNKIKNTNIWADNSEIIALQKYLKINIHIYIKDSNNLGKIYPGCIDNNLNYNQHIKVFYNGSNHYDSLIRCKKC